MRPIALLHRYINELNFKYELITRNYNYGDTNVRYNTYYYIDLLEEPLIEKLVNEVESGEVLYDVGSHIGMASLLCAIKKDVYSIMFDPNPQVIEKASKHVEVNDLMGEIDMMNIAIADEPGSDSFFISSNDEHSSFDKDHAEISRYGKESVERVDSVQIETIDSLVDSGITIPDRIKIDVEGFGWEVVRGGKNTLRTYRPVVYFEAHYDKGGKKMQKVLDIFRSLKYKKYPIKENPNHQWIFRPL